MNTSSLHLPDAIIRQLDCAADAVRRKDLDIALHHTGNALLMLKEAQAARAAKRKGREGPPPLRRVK
jgi:hypothetical protein